MSSAQAEMIPLRRDSRPDAGELGTTSRPGWADVFGLAALGVVLMVLSYFQSRHRMFWGDEIMGVYVLRSGSWHRFLELWHGGIDSSGFWFYVFAKPWEWVLGASQMRLRMFSAVGIFTSAALIWLAARRFYSVGVVAAAVAVPYLNLGVLRWQLANARCYGVLMASTALVIYLIVRGTEGAYDRPRLGFLAATFFAYDFLAGSHILGVLFASALLATQIAVDLRNRNLRVKLYAAAVAGICAILLFSLQNIRSTTALGKPVFWTVQPLVRSYVFLSPVILGIVGLLIFMLFLLAFYCIRRQRSRDVVYILMLGVFLLHTAFVFISRVSTSIYVDRYLLPMSFALVLVIAELLTQMLEAKSVSRARYAMVYAGVWLVPLMYAPRPSQFGMPTRNYTDAMLADLPPDLPVVDTDVGTFVEQEYYHHGHFGRPFLFPIDDGITNDRTNLGGVSGFHEMDNFVRLGIDAPDLQGTREILERYPAFVVVTAAAPTSWFRRRIQESGAYAVTDLGPHPYGPVALHLWEVHRTVPPGENKGGRERG